MVESKITKFKRTVWNFYRKNGRHDLPWRHTRDAYKILVSEVMLQQTQVHRVLPMYAEFTRRFPTAESLASSSLASVLQSWQGLGYNRRAKQLQTAAEKLLTSNPRTPEELQKLPGVGPYTARAVAAFAYNQSVVFIETNIRTAVTYHFFANKKKVSDKEIEKILTAALPKGKARKWYWALMDYGAYLKKSGVKLNARNVHYRTQSKFFGSSREARGAILRELSSASRRRPATESHLLGLLGDDRVEQLRAALTALLGEGLIQIRKRGRVFTLPR